MTPEEIPAALATELANLPAYATRDQAFIGLNLIRKKYTDLLIAESIRGAIGYVGVQMVGAKISALIDPLIASATSDYPNASNGKV